MGVILQYKATYYYNGTNVISELNQLINGQWKILQFMLHLQGKRRYRRLTVHVISISNLLHPQINWYQLQCSNNGASYSQYNGRGNQSILKNYLQYRQSHISINVPIGQYIQLVRHLSEFNYLIRTPIYWGAIKHQVSCNQVCRFTGKTSQIRCTGEITFLYRLFFFSRYCLRFSSELKKKHFYFFPQNVKHP